MKAKVYRGWLNIKRELPDKVTEDTRIRFGNTKWYPDDVKVKITVEFVREQQKGGR